MLLRRVKRVKPLPLHTVIHWLAYSVYFEFSTIYYIPFNNRTAYFSFHYIKQMKSQQLKSFTDALGNQCKQWHSLGKWPKMHFLAKMSYYHFHVPCWVWSTPIQFFFKTDNFWPKTSYFCETTEDVKSPTFFLKKL